MPIFEVVSRVTRVIYVEAKTQEEAVEVGWETPLREYSQEDESVDATEVDEDCLTPEELATVIRPEKEEE